MNITRKVYMSSKQFSETFHTVVVYKVQRVGIFNFCTYTKIPFGFLKNHWSTRANLQRGINTLKELIRSKARCLRRV